ncbi:MAG: DUF2971 domain-containing protein [Candidatus Eisenbacteria bacterium]|nr:DUF2971 domain-containing protein [Candidatus Eisenbacteria bacterium]
MSLKKERAARDARLMDELLATLPKRLYRYLNNDTHQFDSVSDALKGNALHFCSYASLNDPFDGACTWNFNSPAADIEAYWRELVDLGEVPVSGNVEAQIDAMVRLSNTSDGQRQLQQESQKSFRDQALCCLSLEPCNPLLWAHYGGGLKGACLEFDAVALFHSLGTGHAQMVPVQYKANLGECRFYEAGDIERGLATLATKGEEWRYEAEWRLIRKDAPGLQCFQPTALTGVLLGERMSPEEQVRVRALAEARANPILCSMVKPCYDSFSLTLVR